MIDVVIPMYNAEQTLVRAVQSVLNQPQSGIVWLVDDGSTDGTLALAQQLQAQVPQKIRVEAMPYNGGVAKARNWGALQSSAEFVAFLDADDAYENGALQVAEAIFQFQPQTALVRLALKPVGLAARYADHPHFAKAWQHMAMTCGGNVVFRRAFLLACGGFPQQALFRRFGGEDGALGIATTHLAPVATAFNDCGVLHYCRDGMHAERLLDGLLFGKADPDITPEHLAQANSITAEIQRQTEQLKFCLNSGGKIMPMDLKWG